jgi:hypothetical protein
MSIGGMVCCRGCYVCVVHVRYILLGLILHITKITTN